MYVCIGVLLAGSVGQLREMGRESRSVTILRLIPRHLQENREHFTSTSSTSTISFSAFQSFFIQLLDIKSMEDNQIKNFLGISTKKR